MPGKESDYSMIQRNVIDWELGVEKKSSQIDKEYVEIRRNISHTSIAHVFSFMECFETTKPKSRGGDDSENKYKRKSLPGKICDSCYYNNRSRVPCQIIKEE